MGDRTFVDRLNGIIERNRGVVDKLHDNGYAVGNIVTTATNDQTDRISEAGSRDGVIAAGVQEIRDLIDVLAFTGRGEDGVVIELVQHQMLTDAAINKVSDRLSELGLKPLTSTEKDYLKDVRAPDLKLILDKIISFTSPFDDPADIYDRFWRGDADCRAGRSLVDRAYGSGPDRPVECRAGAGRWCRRVGCFHAA